MVKTVAVVVDELLQPVWVRTAKPVRKCPSAEILAVRNAWSGNVRVQKCLQIVYLYEHTRIDSDPFGPSPSQSEDVVNEHGCM